MSARLSDDFELSENNNTLLSIEYETESEESDVSEVSEESDKSSQPVKPTIASSSVPSSSTGAPLGGYGGGHRPHCYVCLDDKCDLNHVDCKCKNLRLCEDCNKLLISQVENKYNLICKICMTYTYKMPIQEKNIIIQCAGIIDYRALFTKYKRLKFNVAFNIKLLNALDISSDFVRYFDNLSNKVLTDEDFLLACFAKFPNFCEMGIISYTAALKYASCCMIALRQNYTYFKYFPKHIKNNLEICKYTISINPDAIQWMKGDILKCKHSAVLAASKDYSLLQYFDMSIRSDEAFVKEIMKIEPCALLYMSDDIKQNKELCKIAISHDYCILPLLPKNMCDDYSIVKIAVSKNPDMIKFASNNLKMNTRLCKIAFAVDKTSLRFFNPTIYHLFPAEDVANAIMILQK